MANPEHVELCRSGAEAIARWRRQHGDDLTLDLTSADLSRLSLYGANLARANCRHANFSYADLGGANLSRCDLRSCDFSKAVLRHARLVRSNLADANCRGADFADSELTQSTFNGSDCSESRLSGAKLREANLAGACFYCADLEAASLVSANLSGAAFGGATLTKANARSAIAQNAVFSGAQMDAASFAQADLSSADMSNVSARKANFARASVTNATLRQAILDGSSFSNAVLSQSNLLRASFLKVECAGADMAGVMMGETALGESDLSDVLGLEDIIHVGPSSIDFENVFRNSKCLPVAFLVGIGIDERIIRAMRSVSCSESFSGDVCIICHAKGENDLACRVERDLRANAIRCWRWELSKFAQFWGDDDFDGAAPNFDKLVVIATEETMNDWTLALEIERAVIREQEVGEQRLAIVKRDGFIDDGWKHAWRHEILNGRVIIDGAEWESDDRKYNAGLSVLKRQLHGTKLR